MSEFHHLFGPVPSRRLGRSLGIDLVPLKTCSFDCVFCQAGHTTCHTLERKEYVSVREVLDEFDAWLAAGGAADFVTLSGSGEPTLHSRFGDVLEAVGARCDARRALLSNGSLFHLPEVRAGAAHADLVKVSLSAWDEATLAAVNRPHAGLTIEAIVSGLTAFRTEFSGELWLEVFVLAGVNDSPEGIRQIAGVAKSIRPDRVHLNTVVRKPAERSARSVSAATLEAIADLFTPRADVIADLSDPGIGPDTVGNRPILTDASMLDTGEK